MLTSLTAEQRERIPEYVQRYISIGTSTDPMNFDLAKEAVIEMYHHAKVPAPKEILPCSNPILATQKGHKMAFAMDGVGGKTILSLASLASGASRFAFLAECCGVKINAEPQRQTLEKFIRNCGGVYPHSEFAIIFDRPALHHLRITNGVGILHCEDGPAIAWGRDESGQYDPNHPEAYAMYYFQGTKVPKHWIMEKPGEDPEKRRVRAAEILSCKNQEQLRAGCEIIGWLPVLEALGMRELDCNPNPMIGRLVEVDLPNAPGSKFLVAKCGTGRTIAVSIHQDAKTALQAGAMSYGVPESVYAKLKVRT
jgi:hypothetical protein